MRRLMTMALAAIGAVVMFAEPSSAQPASQVRCESRNFQPNVCPVYNARDVRMVNQLGGSCRNGIDWNFDGRSINVRNGCRADFAVYGGGNWNGGGGNWNGGSGNWNGGGNAGSAVIICESQNFRRTRCPIQTGGGGVQLQRQLGNTQCIQGRSWGYDRGGIWVDNGCRGEFLVGRAGYGNGGGNWNGGGWNGGNQGVRFVECSSRNYRPQRCNMQVDSVSIDRVLGGECIQGRTWGWDRRGIWVNDGCRARFRVS